MVSNISNYSSSSQFNSRQNLSFSGNKAQLAKKAKDVALKAAPHLAYQTFTQAISQPILPVLNQCIESFDNPSLSRLGYTMIVKAVADTTEVFGHLVFKKRMSLSESPTNLFVLAKTGIVSIKKAITKH